MTYRLELAKTNRSGCGNTECKKNGEKIAKGTLRHGVLVTIKDNQTWRWRHWGCVTPVLIANMNEVIDNNFDYLDGYDELSEDAQETVRRAFEQGHVDDEDWRGDVEQNRPGAKGFRTPVKKQKKPKAVLDDEGTDSPSKPAPKKRGRAKKEDVSDADGTNQAPAKKPKAAAKKAKVADLVDDDEEPPPKKARGRKKAVKKEEDDQDGAVPTESDEPIPPPVSKSRAPRKAAKAAVVEDDDDMDGDMKGDMEEAVEPKKGRKKTVGKGSKDHAADPAETKAPNGTARKGSRGKKC